MLLNRFVFQCIFFLLIGKGASSLFGGTLKFLRDSVTVCRYSECCDEEDIPGNTELLKRELKHHLFGQDLVIDTVVNAIEAHWDPRYTPSKPLTLSFHGNAGVGKNYVTNFIANSLYRKGFQSKFVHVFMGRNDFPLEANVHHYQDNLVHWIIGNITECSKQLFIFDETDKIPSGVLNAVKSIIDYNSHMRRIDHKRSIFIFISNTGSSLIMKQTIDMWNEGFTRQDMKLNHFENLIAQGAFNEEGGFHYSETIKSNLIDHYIPFLPLEHEHVVLCIKTEFSKRDFLATEQQINEVMEFVEWGPPVEQIFAKTGCKRLSQKVALLIQTQRVPARYEL